MQSKRAFFKEAIKDIKTSGTIAPSSKYLIHRILKSIDFSKNVTIIELGAGNGKITAQILKRMNAQSKLLSFEINDEFYLHLKENKDHRFNVVSDSAVDIKEVCKDLQMGPVTHIISSLPLTNMAKKESHHILRQCQSLLSRDGHFLQYQYSLTYYNTLKKIFNDKVNLQIELRNIPPAFIYNCIK